MATMLFIPRTSIKFTLTIIPAATLIIWLLYDTNQLYSGNSAELKTSMRDVAYLDTHGESGRNDRQISDQKRMVNDFNYVMSDDAKSWFAGNISFPVTLDRDYVITPRNLCPQDADLDYLIVVHTATGHQSFRQAIRDTFGRRHLFGHITQRTVFLLGLSNKVKRNKNIENEARIHNDIVQGNFIDHYHNITHKAVMGLRWINEFCPRVKLIFKTDDDTIVNIFKVVDLWLPKYTPKYRHIICEIVPKNEKLIARLHQPPERWMKWLVEEWWFRGLTHYPFDHCNGYFLMFTADLVAPMLAAARVNPFFWVDDIYIYGMLPLTVGDVTFAELPLSRRTNFVWDFQNCINQTGVTACDIFLNDNRITAEHFPDVWTNMIVHLSDKEKLDLHVNDTGI